MDAELELGIELSPPLPFDVVESILSLLPAADLLAASDVSTAWRHAALSSSRRRPPPLLVHSTTLRHRAPTTAATSLLDPLSPSSCLSLPPLPSPPSPLRCSSSSPSLLYTLDSSELCFSSDPLHLRWTHLPAPSVWRLDPLVALVGPYLVVAGGVSEFFGDDPLSVEVFRASAWTAARPMPATFARSAVSGFLSATVAGGRMHVVDRRSGLHCSFDPEEGSWSGTTELLACVKSKPFALAVAGTGEKLVFAGVVGEARDVSGVKVWEMGCGGEMGMVEVAEMPEEMVRRFARGPRKDSAAGVSAVEVRTAEEGELVYVYNPSDMREVFYWRGGEWGCVASPVEMGWSPAKTVAVTCSPVPMEELREALRRAPMLSAVQV